ncbi:hypothetical protein [Novosphingobium subterraneum]|uniref:Flagellar hook-length control protein FliK n=2 Tax=Novosphingobium subterraneum TaxID=48936 RepID=A0A0B9A156_9SPHN|nr:hypothetical protein [Novosphingobium subterraneum]KHS44334.1 hypothetical protein NJ75_03203 [Novosphingobium subterraneum]
MFDLAALSQPTAAPALQAAPLQNGGNGPESADGITAAPGIAFDALLAMQFASAEPADAPLPESGKILPDAAKLLAALPQVRPTDVQVRPQPTKARTDAEQAEDDFRDAPELPDGTLPDSALIAALFAAPDRLVPAEGAGARPSTEVPCATVASAAPAPTAPQSPAQTAIALARTAQIELTTEPETAAAPVQPEAVAATPTAQIMAARQVRQNKSTGAEGETSEASAQPALVAGAKPLMDSERAETPRVEATSTTSLLADRSLPTPDNTAPSSVRHEARSERVDFAALVDNLARAREEASPRAVTASINHAEFGRVTLRFDQGEDRGMSVAMTSADPGFARAVSATAEAARASGESAGQNHQPQADSRTQGGQGESQRQQPRQAEQAPTRPFSGNGTSSREEEAPRRRSDDRGIYA